MRVTVLGGCGAWPTAVEPCTGYVLEEAGFRLVVDLGYATLPRLLAHMDAGAVDALVISHGHPDHCADLNPLLRARALGNGAPGALPVYSLTESLDAVLALDRPGMLSAAYIHHEFDAGDRFAVGPFVIETRLLQHYVPNAGLRISSGGVALAYTGDCGPGPEVVDLARGADLLIAEATFTDEVPTEDAGRLSSARDAGHEAAEAGVGRLLLTHLWPGTEPDAAHAAAALYYPGSIDVARSGLVIDVD